MQIVTERYKKQTKNGEINYDIVSIAISSSTEAYFKYAEC